ncbi:DUF92 domain-containing protein [Panacibacter ginsenosidivorans]|uniref:DUF92 domain-containing protein n=1 Tax=Panacibacter ginsenosidivorans TaxID=1813871 RepID=A0A5B8V8C2_9BACT|nr:DUF92 domain-containing protein [Panacibacter ginsenosidivorans]QEC67479.1 DUF92 domain-containing protein [Panacibacter ginsenosidivorans]
MHFHDIVILIVIITGVLLSIIFKKLTIHAALTGAIIAWFVFIGTGYTGVIMMTSFFILGTAATLWKIKAKQQLGLAEINKGKRTAPQVIANAGIAALLSIIIWLYPLQKELVSLMIAAVFSSATADTLSSELGNIYGSKFYNIITFKEDQRGLNGVVSIEGTLIGLAGSSIIAIIYAIGFDWTNKYILLIIVAGTTGNLADSLLGATAERKFLLGNNTVNFLNTFTAAITALLLYLL